MEMAVCARTDFHAPEKQADDERDVIRERLGVDGRALEELDEVPDAEAEGEDDVEGEDVRVHRGERAGFAEGGDEPAGAAS
jgi:hypothetical protein